MVEEEVKEVSDAWNSPDNNYDIVCISLIIITRHIHLKVRQSMTIVMDCLTSR